MKISDIEYSPSPKPELDTYVDNLMRYAALSAELGKAGEGQELIERSRQALLNGLRAFDELVRALPSDSDEPESLEEIRAQRPDGVRRQLDKVGDDYLERLTGSILGRGAGCTLGATVEFWTVDQMEAWGRQFGEEYPPTDFFQYTRDPNRPRYIVGNASDLTRGKMSFIPVDDDTAYTLIGLLTMEEFGAEFTPEQQAELWLRNFPIRSETNGSWGIYWGERNLLENLNRGLPVEQAGYANNPNVQSIAAWTRADSWGYVAPGWPEKAAELAYKDASINHRRNGVYGSMFFAAAVSAAFAVDSPIEALKVALQEIPKNSLLAEGVRWAFEIAPQVKNYRDASDLVHERYAHMFEGHAINNALYVVFGILLGDTDFTRSVGETVAMGYDNDCTGATAASITGAAIGKKAIPSHWISPFENRIQSYLRDLPDYLDVDEVAQRYLKQAEQILNS
jgi:ADP-ribosylglycohydrolase